METLIFILFAGVIVTLFIEAISSMNNKKKEAKRIAFEEEIRLKSKKIVDRIKFSEATKRNDVRGDSYAHTDSSSMVLASSFDDAPFDVVDNNETLKPTQTETYTPSYTAPSKSYDDTPSRSYDSGGSSSYDSGGSSSSYDSGSSSSGGSWD